MPRLQSILAGAIPEGSLDQIQFDETDADNNTILFHYAGVIPGAAIAPMLPYVRIEMGPRGDDWPSTRRSFTPYLETALPGTLEDGGAVSVQVLDAERTFLEKAMLLHEDNFRPPGRPRKPRMARHYYDLYRMIEAGVGERAMADADLLDRVRHHREFYYPVSWVDYETMKPGRLRLVPRPDTYTDWASDYHAMRDVFFFGPSPDFDEMMLVVQRYQDRTNGSMKGAT